MRAKAGLPQLLDVDDLPDPAYDPNYVHVLSDKEQKDLHKRQFIPVRIGLTTNNGACVEQEKFQRHQTWYRAHGTETHRVSLTRLIFCDLR